MVLLLLDRQLGLYLEKGRIEKMQEKIEEIKKQAEERIKEIKDSKARIAKKRPERVGGVPYAA